MIRVRYTVPKRYDEAVEQYNWDSWVHALVDVVADSTGERHRDILGGDVCRTFDVPAELLNGGVDADRAEIDRRTPTNVRVREVQL